MLILYKILTFIIYYATLPFTFLSYVSGSGKWGNRLGFLHRNVDRAEGHCDIWLHASSMGEVKVLGILGGELKKLNGDLRLYITLMTETGFQKAGELIGEYDSVGFIPLDYHVPIRRFMKSIRPRAAVFIETEIWPNVILELGRKRIPLFLANGRLSQKTCRQYRWFRSGLKKVFKNYEKVMVQTDADRERFIEIGADGDIIEVIGSLKFDAPVRVISPDAREELKRKLPFAADSRIFIAGSIRNGEDEIIIDVFSGLIRDFPDLRLILVPRHLDRIENIGRLLSDRAIKSCLYSARGGSSEEFLAMTVDEMGVLNNLYNVSDIAFVGGTLVEIGGHNILEPVWSGVPVLFGPSIYNVRDGADYIIEGNYGVMVRDGDDLSEKLRRFLAGEIKFMKKSSETNRPSRAGQTARIILESMQSDAKTLAENSNR